MAQKEQVIKDLDKIISLIRTDSDQISADDKKKMVDDTLHYFDNYVSPGWLKYRKSVSSDSENGAVLEWHKEETCAVNERHRFCLSYNIIYYASSLQKPVNNIHDLYPFIIS